MRDNIEESVQEIRDLLNKFNELSKDMSNPDLDDAAKEKLSDEM